MIGGPSPCGWVLCQQGDFRQAATYLAQALEASPNNPTVQYHLAFCQAKLGEVAKARGQSLAQMAIAWVLRRPEVTSALTGASRVAQVEELVAALAKPDFSADELKRIDAITA